MRHIESVAPSPVHVKQCVQGYVLSPDAPMSLTDLECPICYDTLDRPVEMPCGKLACASCVVEWVLPCSVSCPICFDDTLLDTSSFRPPPAVVLKLISSLTVICGKCGERVRAANHREHLDSKCKLHIQMEAEASQSLPQITLDAVLSQPLDAPPLETEIKAASNIIQRTLLHTQERHLSVPTKGKVKLACTRILMHLP